ncbi:AraC family transcriptional regulator [Paenibacillus sp. N4]|uniref:AraC family transcriptional regulator n=1 Tax=Paenibacillus vietnamensis TaxID=2590547 RepID=UPI001CD082F4|nr:AraC family transcriptional regulator [Paenibacillus vietnamensis]MCA0757879.1 AraC family transcriptional regulator [Paenibacillus vietnamensis]
MTTYDPDESKPILNETMPLSSYSRNTRWTYDTAVDPPICQVPELVMLGSDELRKALPLFEHEHPGCYEFVLIERGKAGWELEGEQYETPAGHLFHSRPGEKHRGSFNVIEPCKFWWVIMQAPIHDGWLRLPAEECLSVQEALARLPRVKHVGLPPVEKFKRLKDALLSKSQLRGITVRAALLDLLLACIDLDAGLHEIAADLRQRFDRLIERLGTEPEWRPSVDELASFAGVSASHFYRTFQEYTGEPPITFAERLRVKEACRQLETSRNSITDIAFRLGYPSSQHFATVFKRYIGTTPTQWRKSRQV